MDHVIQKLKETRTTTTTIATVSTMGMAYAQEHWTKSVDLTTAVERSLQELSAIVFEVEHEEVYGRGDYSLDYLTSLRKQYNEGIKLCKKFFKSKIRCRVCLSNNINAIGLKTFADQIKLCLEKNSIASSSSLSSCSLSVEVDDDDEKMAEGEEVEKTKENVNVK